MLNSESINVHTDIFEGPMDLLLYLIRKDNLDIYDIPISQITKEYLEYLEVMSKFNLDVAGEFLVMASTLMQIKAKMLLPSPQEEAGEEGPDPRTDLIEKITQYRKFKQASQYLENRFEHYKDIFYRHSPVFGEKEKTINIEIFDLIGAVKKALSRTKDDSELVNAEEFPIEVKMEKIISALKNKTWLLVDDIFEGETKKSGVIACFLALLELMKLRRIIAGQDKPFSEIRLYLRPKEEEVLPEV
ncbi:MAG TPA: segregation/condensation protein A [Elusimicrobiales bacterium]|nr:segregation/condensation protein A [Elusimicrobiales bacterium]